jgi:DNA-binding MarR family transcriptional regulator
MPSITRDITELARCGNQYRNDRLSSLGLKGCHASFLLEVCNHPGISQDRLASLICVNKSNIARHAATLEENGFITRHPSAADKRVLELSPTEKALNLLPELRDTLRTWRLRVTADLTEEEQAQLSALLAKMKIRAAEYMEER